MIRKELISEISKDTGFSKKDISAVMDSMTKIIEDRLVNEEDVLLTGFGKFSTAKVEARVGRNPRTGESVDIPEHIKPTFSYCTAMKNKVR